MSGNFYGLANVGGALAGGLMHAQMGQQTEDAILRQMAAAQGQSFQTLGALIGGGHVTDLMYGHSPVKSVLPTPRKGKSVFNTIATDVKSFVIEHRSILYFVVIALVVDHLLFRGVFKTRLQAMMESMISKVEEKVGTMGAKA